MSIVHNKTLSEKMFVVFNYLFLGLLMLSCLLPIIHILAISLSDSAANMANKVKILPVGFHLDAYNNILNDPRFYTAFGISLQRTLIGAAINMLLIVVTAYPLALEKEQLKGRDTIMWYIFFPMLFSGGLIPFYILVRDVGLINSFWVLIIPGAVQIFNIIIMMNFYRGLPKELAESAMLDGAGHFTILFYMYIPVSMAAIASLTMFSIVGHWNDWFTGLIFLNNSSKWPLQTLLSQMIISIDMSNITKDDLDLLKKLSNRGLRAAQIFVAMLPILMVYPFLQKYFVKGIVIGSVKG